MNEANPLRSYDYTGLDRVLRRIRPEWSFDLGANEGQKLLPLVAHSLNVVAFEPVEDVRIRLRSLFPRVHVFPYGISDEPEVLRQVLPCFSWCLLPPNNFPRDVAVEYKGVKPFDVQCITLDMFCEMFGQRPDFLKVDIDGYEGKFLRGAVQSLTHRPPMMMELSNLGAHIGVTAFDLVTRIYDFGYKAVSVDLKYVCPNVQTLLDYFPYHSSFDVLLLSEHTLKLL